MSVFSQLDDTELLNLIDALQRDRLTLPITKFNLRRYLSDSHLEVIIAELDKLTHQGWSTGNLLYLLQAIATERHQSVTLEREAELVWTHPNDASINSRDTHVVALNLIRQAKSSLTLATYSFDNDQRGREFLAPLIQRFDDDPNFKLRIFCNIKQKWGETRSPEDLTARFAHQFRNTLWNGDRLPPVFYDPRALSSDWTQRACLHTKCIIADLRYTLLTSANFTEASRKRNIETGVLLTSQAIARQLETHFNQMVNQQHFQQLVF